jgi:hypothetical protein
MAAIIRTRDMCCFIEAVPTPDSDGSPRRSDLYIVGDFHVPALVDNLTRNGYQHGWVYEVGGICCAELLWTLLDVERRQSLLCYLRTHVTPVDFPIGKLPWPGPRQTLYKACGLEEGKDELILGNDGLFTADKAISSHWCKPSDYPKLLAGFEREAYVEVFGEIPGITRPIDEVPEPIRVTTGGDGPKVEVVSRRTQLPTPDDVIDALTRDRDKVREETKKDA